MTDYGLVDPRVDAYGLYARAGALADYVEVNALHGRKITRADLADIAQEQGWSRKERRTILIEGDDPEEDPLAWSEMAFGEIDIRRSVLGDLYPFGEARGAPFYRPDAAAIEDDPYIALLGISVVHAWSLPATVAPTVVLEDVVRRTLLGRSLLSADMGTGDRQGLTFVDNLLLQGDHCGLFPSKNPVPRKAHAKDAGVDTLGSLSWQDGRTGNWVFIGQVTCATSLNWERKLKEADPERWRSYLQEGIPPQPFLAVPYHIDNRQWEDLMAIRHGILLDRLRICPSKGANSSDEKLLIESLVNAHVE